MSYHSVIRKNTEIIYRIHKAIHSTLPDRDKSPSHFEAWENACTEFHNNYSELSYFYKYDDCRKELRQGNNELIEYSLCFLEVRPYYFRSGYLYKDLIRVLKNCPLTNSQMNRYNSVKNRYNAFLSSRKI